MFNRFNAYLSNSKTPFVFLTVALVVVLLPFYILSFSNYYSLDDFIFASNRQMFGFFDSILFNYNIYNGRYFTVALINLLGPFKGHEYLAALTPLVIITGLFLSVRTLIRALFQTESAASQNLLLCIFTIPLIALIKAPAEILYWTSGGVCYGVAVILFLFFLSGLIHFFKNGLSHKESALFILNYIFLIGTNETIVIISDLILGIAFVVYFFQNKKISWKLMWFGVIGVLFTLVVLLAPGNESRLAMSEPLFAFTVKKNIPVNLEMTCDYLLKLITAWFSHIIVIISNISFFLWLFLNKKRTGSVYYLIFVIIGLLILIISAFPPFYALGWNPPERTTFVFQTFFLLVNFLFIYVLYSFSMKMKFMQERNIDPGAIYLTCSLAFIWAAFASNNNVRYAYENIYSGHAAYMKQEIDKRLEQFNKGGDDTVCVNDLKYKPEIIFHSDFDPNSSASWMNVSTAGFYNLKGIKLLPQKNYNVYYTSFFNLDKENKCIGSNTPIDDSVYLSPPNSFYLDNGCPYSLNYLQSISDIKDHKLVNRVMVSYKYASQDTSIYYELHLLIKNAKTDELIYQDTHVSNFKNSEPGKWKDASCVFQLHQRSLFNRRGNLFFYLSNVTAGAKVNFDDFTFRYID